MTSVVAQQATEIIPVKNSHNASATAFNIYNQFTAGSGQAVVGRIKPPRRWLVALRLIVKKF